MASFQVATKKETAILFEWRCESASKKGSQPVVQLVVYLVLLILLY